MMQPLTAVSYLFIAASMFAAIRGRPAIALALLAIPLAIGATAAFQYVDGRSSPLDQLLFPQMVVDQHRLNPGRPGPMPTATILLLSLAALLALRPGLRRSQAILLIASVVFGMMIVSGSAFPLGVIGHDLRVRHGLISIPSACAAASLSLGFIAWRHHDAWPGLLSAPGIEGRTLRTIFSLVLVIPGLIALISLWAVDQPAATAELIEILEAGAYVIFAVTLLFWSWTRITRVNRARWAITRALDSAPIALTDPEGRIMHWSKGCERLYQWPAEDAVGRNKHELLQTNIPSQWDDIEAILGDNIPHEREIIEHRRDGTPLHILEQARLLQSRQEDQPLVVLSMTDITDREQRATALAARESELRSILETAPDAVVTFDKEGTIRSFSTTAERLYGHAAADVIGRNIKMLVPPRFHELSQTLLASENDLSLRRFDNPSRPFRALRADGNEVPVEFVIARADVGNESLFTAFVRDISEQLAARDRQEELRAELLHVTRLGAMGELAAGLAHELSQPLAATTNFLGAAEMLLGDRQPDTQKALQLVHLANTQALRAGEIIQRLRTFVSKGHVEVRVEPVEAIAADAVCLAITSTEEQRIELRYEFDAAHRLILADRVQIQQVLVNLLRNAVEAMKEHSVAEPLIIVGSQGADPGMTAILVSDNGPGIAPEILQRPYEPFVTTKSGGMGIGLSISRRIVEAHGGQLFAENHDAGGARVSFTVPAGEMTGPGL